jgi:hypothetical protein
LYKHIECKPRIDATASRPAHFEADCKEIPVRIDKASQKGATFRLSSLARPHTNDRLSLMPSSTTVESFVQLVEGGKTLEAMVRYYAEHASMQENAASPRVGKSALIKHEEDALASIASMKATCVRPFFVAGDLVVIRWVFEIQDKKGQTMRFEELAYQRWEGELMAEEKFFYDPAQLK